MISRLPRLPRFIRNKFGEFTIKESTKRRFNDKVKGGDNEADDEFYKALERWEKAIAYYDDLPWYKKLFKFKPLKPE